MLSGTVVLEGFSGEFGVGWCWVGAVVSQVLGGAVVSLVLGGAVLLDGAVLL